MMSDSKKVRIFRNFSSDLSTGLTEAGRAVKNLDVKKAKPSIFIGSTTESHHIAEKIQKLFNLERFEVDTWQMNIFGQTDRDGNKLKNAEQLKNFTDIYDFAVFLFTPDDKIVSQTRIDVEKGSLLEAKATRHNIVFEFGMFLGRIGAERSFILYEDGVSDFIKLFFTDLKENINDGDEIDLSSKSNRFRIESYKYEGSYEDYIKSGGEVNSYNESSLSKVVGKIEKKIFESLEGIQLTFLPSTSLAKGYFNNFVLAVYRAMREYKSASKLDDLDVNIKANLDKDPSRIPFVKWLIRKKRLKFYLVMPSSILMTKLDSLEKIVGEEMYFNQIAIPTPERMRNRSIYYLKEEYTNNKEDFFVFDLPATLNASIQAINLTTDHPDIRELLSEKERTNFQAMFKYFIQKESEKYDDITEYIEVINWDEFVDITSFNVKLLG